MRDRMWASVQAAQDEICAGLAALEGADFEQTSWERPGGGGGRSRLIQDGHVIEKGGVNVSAVHGELGQDAAKAMSARGVDTSDRRFFATGLSLVIHPVNPFAPTVHANYRYFELGAGNAPAAWWFGGGADLTPSYLFEEDAVHFHRVLKELCDRHDPAFHARFKAWCDDYFFVKHRGEARGLGGIFYDDLHDRPAPQLAALAEDGLRSFLPGYLPILERRKGTPYTEAQRIWQRIRRGRYVEFNLVWDRGTHFGLRTDARVESVLMSLPLNAMWVTGHEPESGSPEADIVAILKAPRDWV
jgi:coproporphyrinogen III oxidase